MTLWSTCGQEPWYVENDEARAYSSVGIAQDGEVKAIAVWIGERDHADEMVAALNAGHRQRVALQTALVAMTLATALPGVADEYDFSDAIEAVTDALNTKGNAT